MRLTAVGLGLGFGFALAWSGMTDPDLIRRMLLLEDAYFVLVILLDGGRLHRCPRPEGPTGSRPADGRPRFLEHERSCPPPCHRKRPLRSRLTSLSCPGPIAAQLGQGLLWSLCTITGVGAGIVVHARWRRRAAPAGEPLPSH